MKITALLLAFTVSYVGLGSPLDAPAGADEPHWVCTGPVHECRTNKDKGAREGCTRSVGEGDTHDQAVADALGACASKLDRDYPDLAPFACLDGSQLTCSRK